MDLCRSLRMPFGYSAESTTMLTGANELIQSALLFLRYEDLSLCSLSICIVPWSCLHACVFVVVVGWMTSTLVALITPRLYI